MSTTPVMMGKREGVGVPLTPLRAEAERSATRARARDSFISAVATLTIGNSLSTTGEDSGERRQ